MLAVRTCKACFSHEQVHVYLVMSESKICLFVELTDLVSEWVSVCVSPLVIYVYTRSVTKRRSS